MALESLCDLLPVGQATGFGAERRTAFQK